MVYSMTTRIITPLHGKSRSLFSPIRLAQVFAVALVAGGVAGAAAAALSTPPHRRPAG